MVMHVEIGISIRHQVQRVEIPPVRREVRDEAIPIVSLKIFDNDASLERALLPVERRRRPTDADLQAQYAFGPISGAATNVVLLSYLDDAFIGINADPAAITDPDDFVACLRAGFDEVLDFRPGLPRVQGTYGATRVLLDRPFDGRLPPTHRLDVSLERVIAIRSRQLQLQAGVVNAYDRTNIFYYDIFTTRRVDQLPLAPYLSVRLQPPSSAGR